MIKKNSFINKFKKILISANEIIESFFNNLNALFLRFKKRKNNLQSIDKKILISAGSAVILILTYFLVPSFYDKKVVIKTLEKQILKKYNLDLKLNESLKYVLFPKPHYSIKDISINYNEKDFAQSKILKIYIPINNFILPENQKIKNMIFKKTKFNINSANLIFFEKILNFNKSEHSLVFKNSVLFYKDKNEDIIFLINIDNLNFLYNDKFSQELKAKLEIFNIPLKLNIINDNEDKKITTHLESHKLRLSIDNFIDYSEKIKFGSIDFQIINLSKKIDLILDNESLKFSSEEKKFKGNIDLKPFYLSSDLKFERLDFEKLFKENSILMDLLNSEILNNENLNAQLNINFKTIKGINYIKDIILKTYIEEGNLIIRDSILDWKNSIIINLDDIQLINDNDTIMVVGAVSFDFNEIDDFYKQFQIKKIYRKEIKKIKLDFLIDLNDKSIEIDNLKIDEATNKAIDKFLNNFNSKKLDIFNKIIFKNSIKEFFSNI